MSDVDLRTRAAIWEQGYAERSGMSVSRLRELGRVVATCDCGADDCEGFQLVRPENLDPVLYPTWQQVLPEPHDAA